MILDYFYGQAGELFSFYRVPKALEPWLLKKSLGNAVERKQFSGLSVKVVKGHVAFSTFCSSLCSKINRLSFENKKRTLFLLKSGALCNIMAI
jgi:hypothetical protein